MTSTINRTFAAFAALAVLALGVPAFAATPNYTLNPNTQISFVCAPYGTFVHTLGTVNQLPNGTFTGTGFYNSDHAYTWTVAGNVSGNIVTYTVHYTGLLAGIEYTNTGTIAANGSISGSSTGNCQTFTSPTGTATKIVVVLPPIVPTTKDQCKKDGWKTLVDAHGHTFKNQGQCVSSVVSKKHHEEKHQDKKEHDENKGDHEEDND